QVVAWIVRKPARSLRRASRMWALFTLLALGVEWLGGALGFPISPWVVVIASALIAAIFFLPVAGGWGARVRRSRWARAGLAAAAVYLLLCTAAHFVALRRVREFAAHQKLSVQQLAALPLAPSLWHWDGLIRTADGVYRLNEDILHPASTVADYYADSAPENLVEAAKRLPGAQTYLWFARFPLFTASRRDGHEVLDITDMRFAMRQRRRTSGFTFQVTFNSAGEVIQQGMLRGIR
ncbi:MAG: hypothetical protein ACRD5L_12715, partial [Bryobacteraceae bacterium]